MISSSVALFSNGKPFRYDGIVFACCVLFFSVFLLAFSPLLSLFSILFLFLLAPVCHWFSSMATANCISERIYRRRWVSLLFLFAFKSLARHTYFFFPLSLPRRGRDEEGKKADTCHLMHWDGLQFSMLSSLSGVDINIDVCVGCRRPYWNKESVWETDKKAEREKKRLR